MEAPGSDAGLFRQEIIRVPGDHDAYGWLCAVPQCERAQEPSRSLCNVHDAGWSTARAAGGNLADFMRTAEPMKPVSWYHPEDCTICPGIPASGSSPLCYLHTDRWGRGSSPG